MLPPRRSRGMQYYFHIRDGVTLLDDKGHDCADLAPAPTQALATSGAMLKESSGSAEFGQVKRGPCGLPTSQTGKAKQSLRWSSGRYRPPAFSTWADGPGL